MELENIHHKTTPAIVHAPGCNDPQKSNSTPFWGRIRDAVFASTDKFADCNCLTVLTWNSKNEKSVLELCLDHFGLSYEVLGRGIKFWKNCDKIRLAIDCLSQIKTEWVLALDAYDVLLFKHPDTILNEFLGMGSKMLLNAEVQFWPNSYTNSYIEKLKDYQEKLSRETSKYLNAGCYLGETKTCLEFLKAAASIRQPIDPKLSFSEQIRFHAVFEKFDDAELDYRSQIFQNLTHVHDGIRITCPKMYA